MLMSFKISKFSKLLRAFFMSLMYTAFLIHSILFNMKNLVIIG